MHLADPHLCSKKYYIVLPSRHGHDRVRSGEVSAVYSDADTSPAVCRALKTPWC